MFHIDLQRLAQALQGKSTPVREIPKYHPLEAKFHIDEKALLNRLAMGRDKEPDAMKQAIQIALQSSCTVYVYSADGAWTGSGFHIGDGKVVTASHVCPPQLLKQPHRVEVTFDGGTLFPFTILKTDSNSDAAILQCNHAIKSVPAMKLGDSDKVEIGDEIAVVSSPEGWHDTATVGRISNVHQSLGAGAPSKAWVDVIFIDAQILEGSSGGMVVGEDGLVYGIVMGVTGKLAKLGIGEHTVCPINKVVDLLG